MPMELRVTRKEYEFGSSNDVSTTRYSETIPFLCLGNGRSHVSIIDTEVTACPRRLVGGPEGAASPVV